MERCNFNDWKLWAEGVQITNKKFRELPSPEQGDEIYFKEKAIKTIDTINSI